jgi:hypothetical protein
LLRISRANSVALRLFIRVLFHVFATDAAAGVVMPTPSVRASTPAFKRFTFEAMNDCHVYDQIVAREACS